MAELQLLKKLASEGVKKITGGSAGTKDRNTPLSPMELKLLHRHEEIEEQKKITPPKRFSRR